MRKILASTTLGLPVFYSASIFTTTPTAYFQRVRASTTSYTYPQNHHLINSLPSATPFETKCGRTFDPAVYEELMKAMVDQSWGEAIQRNLMEDAEYVSMMRSQGGAAHRVNALVQKGFEDEKFLMELKKMLQEEHNTSLALCAIQDAYVKIRKKRDEHATETAATGSDPYEGLRSRAPEFGTRRPPPV